MDFIERLFHIAPDGGTGFLEISLAFVLVIVPLSVLAVRRFKSGRNRPS